jgi:hypothetical protein
LGWGWGYQRPVGVIGDGFLMVFWILMMVHVEK